MAGNPALLIGCFTTGCVVGWLLGHTYLRWSDKRARKKLIEELSGPAETVICPEGWYMPDGTTAYRIWWDELDERMRMEHIADNWQPMTKEQSAKFDKVFSDASEMFDSMDEAFRGIRK